jgi:hypothetical protein
MQIFTASRLSNGNGLFPVELRIDDYSLQVVKPGLIKANVKVFKYNKITSLEVISPFIGFSKIVISAYNFDKIIVEGFERAEAEEAVRIIETKMR